MRAFLQPATWRILLGFFAIWAVLDLSARLTGSVRGESGFLVMALTLATAVAVEFGLFRARPGDALSALGLRAPNRRGTLAALALGAALLAYFPLFALVTGNGVRLVDSWPWLALGIFAQAGIAEETLFRGYLFRRLREGRQFWPAATLAAVPFILVHLVIFLTMDFALAFVSVLVSVSLAFPLAWLYERSGNSIWPPAFLHFIVQGAIKLVAVDAAEFVPLAIGWMIVSALAPWAVFLVGRNDSNAGPQGFRR